VIFPLELGQICPIVRIGLACLFSVTLRLLTSVQSQAWWLKPIILAMQNVQKSKVKEEDVEEMEIICWRLETPGIGRGSLCKLQGQSEHADVLSPLSLFLFVVRPSEQKMGCWMCWHMPVTIALRRLKQEDQ
jgi:hypothetical protein